MIINTGCRTDIPAYYSKWFYHRIQEGFVAARNPYYPTQVLRYRLTPDVVDCINFCTKNPEPMLDRLDELDAFRQYWMVTITPYGTDIEPHVPDKELVMQSFIKLSKRVGVDAISWRYDPIFITEKYSLAYHIESFDHMAKTLCGYVDNCVISFIDLYRKTKRNFPEAKEVIREERITLSKEFVRIGQKYGIEIRTCCEGTELMPYGVDCSGCMTQEVIEKAIGGTLHVPKQKSLRGEGQCDCLLGHDIGMYNTCGHACLYCYANYDRKTVVENMKQHDPNSPFLIGGYRDGDHIKDAKQESYYSGQMKLMF